MAYRGGAGVWMGMGLLFLLAAIFGALWYNRETNINQLTEEITNASPDSLINTHKNIKVGDLFKEKVALTQVKEKLLEKVNEAEQEVTSLNSQMLELKETARQQSSKISTLTEDAQNKEQRVKSLETQIAQVRKEREEGLRKQIADLREELSKEQVRSEKLSRDLRISQEREQNTRAAFQRRIMELQRVNSGLQQVIDRWTKEAGRRESVKGEEYDGKIIQVDINNKFAVVDLGRVHHVHRGMRFDVIRWRLNRWDYMGSLELTEVDATTSTAVILDAIIQRKLCPLTGYVARYPDEKYSPYAATGANSDRVVELVTVETEEKGSMRELDPIVVGDYITNPFYSKDRQLKFVVVGDGIKYSPVEMKQLIKKYGGFVQEAIDVDTDYLVIGRIPDETQVAESDEAKTRRDQAMKAREVAKEYGIPMMREVELLNFLRN